MSGMLETLTWAPAGSPANSVANVCRASWRNVETEVIVDGDDVQRSLAPSSMVTYSTCWLTASRAWVGPALIRAPVFASLWLCPSIAKLSVRMRSYWLLTPSRMLPPVLQELPG